MTGVPPDEKGTRQEGRAGPAGDDPRGGPERREYASRRGRRARAGGLGGGLFSGRRRSTAAPSNHGSGARSAGPALAPGLRAADRTAELLAGFAQDGRRARPLVWVSAVAPAALLEALGCHLVRPDLAGDADPDTVGLAGRRAVHLSSPGLVVCVTNTDLGERTRFEALADQRGRTVIALDTPTPDGHVHDAEVGYVVRQLEEELIPAAERFSGHRLDRLRFGDAIRYTGDALTIWTRIVDRLAHRPVPVTGFDLVRLMGPLITHPGRPETTDFYRRLLAEIDERVTAGVGAVRAERIRLFWDDAPVFGGTGALERRLADEGAAVVAGTSALAWLGARDVLDPDEPLLSMARLLLYQARLQHPQVRARLRADYADRLGVDGFLLRPGTSGENEPLAGYPLSSHRGYAAWSPDSDGDTLERFLQRVAAARNPAG